MSRTGRDTPARSGASQTPNRRRRVPAAPLLGGGPIPFSRPAVWYPTLGVLALEEIVEIPVVAAVVLGRLLMPGRRTYPEPGPASVADR